MLCYAMSHLVTQGHSMRVLTKLPLDYIQHHAVGIRCDQCGNPVLLCTAPYCSVLSYTLRSVRQPGTALYYYVLLHTVLY